MAAQSARTFRIVQVSDSHLSAECAWFTDNWDVFVNEMRARPPDLVVWSGDVSLRGATGATDLAFAAAERARLPCPVLVLPGNHDIGEVGRAANGGRLVGMRREPPITAHRRRRWRRMFGPDWWTRDIGAWRLYGLNVELCGSGLAAEARQMAFFADALRSADGRPGLLFVHKPLFWADADEERRSAACVDPGPRRAILELCRAHDVRVVASGHLHCYRSLRHEGMRLVWCPATAFISTRRKPGGIPFRVRRRVGYVEYLLTKDRCRHRLVEPDLFITHDVRNWTVARGDLTLLPPRPLARLAPGAY